MRCSQSLGGEGNPLAALTARDRGDFSIALLDGWATIADVLSFYQERIANEGYLRTATERRSVLELARLIGYRLRPGVSASGYLAFSMQKDSRGLIPAGTAAKSVPAPGELPQTFETSGPIEARFEWNEIVPRRTRPQSILIGNVLSLPAVWLQGTSSKLVANDMLLFDFGTQQQLRRVQSIEEDFVNSRTKVLLQEESFSAAAYQRSLLEIVNALGPVPDGMPGKKSIDAALDPLRNPSPSVSIGDLDQEASRAITALSIASVVQQVSEHLAALTATYDDCQKTLTGAVQKAAGVYEPSATTIADSFGQITDLLKPATGDLGALLVALNGALATVPDADIKKLGLTLWNRLRTEMADTQTTAATAFKKALQLAADAFTDPAVPGAAKAQAGAKGALKATTTVLEAFNGSIDQGLSAWASAQKAYTTASTASAASGDATNTVAADIQTLRDAFTGAAGDLFSALKRIAGKADYAHLGDADEQIRNLDLPDLSLLPKQALSTSAQTVSDALPFTAVYSTTLDNTIRGAYTTGEALGKQAADIATPFRASLAEPAAGDQSDLAVLVRKVRAADDTLTTPPAGLVKQATALEAAMKSIGAAQAGQTLPAPDQIAILVRAATQLQATRDEFRQVLEDRAKEIRKNFSDRLNVEDTKALAVLNDLNTWAGGLIRMQTGNADLAAPLVDLLKRLDPKTSAQLTDFTDPQNRARIADWAAGLDAELEALRVSIQEKVELPAIQTVDLASLTSSLGASASAAKPAAVGAGSAFLSDSDAVLRTLIALKPELGVTLYAGLRNLKSSARPVAVLCAACQGESLRLQRTPAHSGHDQRNRFQGGADRRLARARTVPLLVEFARTARLHRSRRELRPDRARQLGGDLPAKGGYGGRIPAGAVAGGCVRSHGVRAFRWQPADSPGGRRTDRGPCRLRDQRKKHARRSPQRRWQHRQMVEDHSGGSPGISRNTRRAAAGGIPGDQQPHRARNPRLCKERTPRPRRGAY